MNQTQLMPVTTSQLCSLTVELTVQIQLNLTQSVSNFPIHKSCSPSDLFQQRTSFNTTPDFIDASRHLSINIHSFFPDQSKGILNANYNIRDIIQSNGFSAEAISIPQLNTLRNDWPNNTTKRFVLNSVNLDAAALSDLQNFEEKDCSYVGCQKCGTTAFGVTEAGVTIDFCRKCKKQSVSGRILRPLFTINDDEGNEIVMSVFANHIADIIKLWDSYDQFKSLINSYSNFDFKQKFLDWLTSVSTEDFFNHFTEEFVYNFVAVNKFDLEITVKSTNGTAYVSMTKVRKSV
ncbi:hypothetical protein WICPIJ_008800 [Wickerhamomyces pijperi]|uniref:Uncharacterized protein n=1 Tax=Wickerhamomyces pijperi TaxID=599730 RepID=A0A9P8TGM7_WICPI|nr:hypothetical protein WICPIJ_008800 [Wickerhamomyces pijperi]